MKRSPLVRRTPLRRTPLKAKRRPDVPAKVRAAVLRRSGGLCEVCGERPAEHLHHRRLRSQGGGHTVDNLLAVCWADHRLIHDQPSVSYAMGWLVRSAA